MILLFILFEIFVFVIALIASFYFINSFFTNAPFVPVKKRVLQQIIKALDLKNNSVLYDLGCGDGRVLLKAIKDNENIKAIGTEKNFIVYLLAKWRTKNTKIKISCIDLKKISLSDATTIYLYLFPNIMNKLLIKINKECKKGTRIVSCSIQFDKLTPDEIIDLPITKDKLCQKIFVYILK